MPTIAERLLILLRERGYHGMFISLPDSNGKPNWVIRYFSKRATAKEIRPNSLISELSFLDEEPVNG